MRKNKLLLLLALLLTAATGAWAQTETLLTTITPTGEDSYSETTTGVVTVSLSNLGFYDEQYGWCWWESGSVTVEAKEGYTITRCVFKQNAKNPVTITTSPFAITFSNEDGICDQDGYGAMNGATSIEVYGAAATASSSPKHLIKATYRERTRSLEQPLPYATTIGELFEAVTGEPFSNLISTMSSMEMPLTGISSNNTSAVSIGELNGASTPVTVNADGKATISINFGSYAYGIFVSAISPLYAKMKDGVKDADKWTVKVGEGQAQALPIGGLKGDGTETVTLQYTGRLKVKGVKAVVEAQADPKLATPLTIEAITAGSITVSNPKAGMQYSLDGGATKNAVTTDEIVLNPGDKVQFYGNGTSITSYGGITALDCTYINGIGDGFTFKVYGNIMSLVDEENFATAKTLSATYTFRNLFNGNTALTDASGLLLPATTLAANCYELMFSGCTALTAAPELPATQLAEACYYNMFYKCTALTAAPELPATELASSCYYYMFSGCTALTAAPELPATELASSCYNQMFRNCTSLTTAPVLPATQLASNCYRSMFMGCTALTASPVLPATELAPSCYYQMFINCSKLATVTCLATSGIGTNSTSNWLMNAGTQAEDTKTVYTSSSASWPMNNNNGIPTGWERVNIDN